MVKSLDYWRRFFGESNSNIIEIIENAVIVAALDYPNEFMMRRDHIAELLFTCKLTNFKSSGEFEQKVSNGEAEALYDQTEEESKLITEVFRIKEIVDNHEESDVTLLDSLGKLQSMDLSVEILELTKIGRSVKGLGKHGSKPIRELGETLILGWTTLVDSWMNATVPIAENTSLESIKTCVDFEEGLPCPPLDEGALFGHAIALSGIFDGMDDDGNPMNYGDANNHCGSGRKQQLPSDLFSPLENKVQQTMKEETVMKKKAVVVKPNKPSRGVTGSTRLAKSKAEQKVNKETGAQLKRDEMSVQKKPLPPQDKVSHKHRDQQSYNGSIWKKPLPPQQEKVKSSDEAALIRVKIEATKRKLQERYQEAEKAKKQRTIQVVELRDIPKQGVGRNRLMKPGHSNHTRHRANARH